MTAARERRMQLQSLDRDALARHQIERFNSLVDAILPQNTFYAEKLKSCRRPIERLSDLAEFPTTTKEELVADVDKAAPAANRTFPLERYVRFHQTSGTRGRPMAVLDTARDWQWWIDTWQYVLDAAEVTEADRAMLAFSFGPFIGFWSAHDALAARGAMVVPGGGMSTLARLEMIGTSGATLVFCTPTYALRMAEVAAEEKFDLASGTVRSVVVAGEPGGSTPAVRERIETAWGARVIDHSGATEVGPWGFGDEAGRGLFVIESEFIAEFLMHGTNEPAPEGELAELVLTTLGRAGAPVIRYRTGDLVRPRCSAGGFVFLEGGVLGRADDMMIVRGVNVFPSSLDQILREFPEVVEYRITATTQGSMDQLRIEVEDQAGDPERIAREMQLRLGLSVAVSAVPPGALPRFEAKSQRFVDNRE